MKGLEREGTLNPWALVRAELIPFPGLLVLCCLSGLADDRRVKDEDSDYEP